MISEIVATYRIKKVDEFCKNGQYTEALEEAWKIPETSSELEISKKLLIGTIYYYLKNYDDALSYLDSIRDCEEEDIIGVIHAYLGCVYQKMGLYEAGLKNIELGLQEGYSEEEEKGEEGCLSLPGISEPVKRSKKIRIKYQDENFEWHDEEYENFFARVIQHEYDHLQGKVFIDRISPIRRQMNRSKISAMLKGKVRCRYNVKTV